jgi:1,4-dihydroxy-6-naphthoate synthase
MHLTIAHSPDSDDAYMMAPLALGWMDPEGFTFDFVRKDIEQLNAEATQGLYDVTAISFGAYPELKETYDLLTAGSSIQEGRGPLVVSKTPCDAASLRDLVIAIPGRRTSAFLSMKKWCAELGFEPKVELRPFDEILPAVVAGEFEAGLLIHESQLMYRDAGLHLIEDLGAWWKRVYDLPLPMGGNAIRRGLPSEAKDHFAKVMRKSVVLARQRHWESVDYSQSFGRGMDRDMISVYVQMWVNDFTEDPGPRGREAVDLLLGLKAEWIQG